MASKIARLVAAFVAAGLACGTAMAQSSPAGAATSEATAGATVGALSRVNAANILKQAQLTGAQLDDQLTKLRTGAGSEASAVQPGISSIGTVPAAAVDDTLPVVRGIIGANGRLVATLLYADGSSFEVRSPGQDVPGGYRVAQFDATHVALTRRGHVYQLAFSSRAPQSRPPNSMQPVMSMPSMTTSMP